jgi:uncharacterized membrane protein YtjA (UPF0391 family)
MLGTGSDAGNRGPASCKMQEFDRSLPAWRSAGHVAEGPAPADNHGMIGMPAARAAASPRVVRLSLESTMLYWSAIFFVIALIAAIFGFGGIADGAVDIAKVLFFLFIVLFLISFVVSLFSRGRGA